MGSRCRRRACGEARAALKLAPWRSSRGCRERVSVLALLRGPWPARLGQIENLPGGSCIPRWPPLPPSRPHRAVRRFGSGLEQDLHRVILLFLEDLVATRALLQRQLVGVKALDPKRITVIREEGHDVLYPSLDVGLAHGELYLLVEERQHRQEIGHATVDTDQGDRSTPPDRVDRQVEGVEAVRPGLLHHLLGDRIGHEGRHLLGEAGAGRAVGLHPYRIDHRVSAPPFGHLTDLPGDVIVLTQVEHLDTIASSPLKALGHEIHPDDPEAEVLGDAAGHVAYWPETHHGHTATLGDVGISDRLPGGGQDVREVDEALVWRSLRDLYVGVLGLGDAQVLGLSAVHISVEFGIAEERRPHALLADLGCLALGLEALVAHEAVSARDLEGDHDAISRGEVGDLGPHLLYYAHRLVA